MTRPSVSSAPSDRAGWAGPLAGLTFLAGIAAGNALADQPYPRPGSDPQTVRRYFHSNPGPARASAAGQLVSALALPASPAPPSPSPGSPVRTGPRDTTSRC